MAQDARHVDGTALSMGRTRKATTATSRPRTKPRGPWVVIMAERDASGEWLTVGESVPGYIFSAMGDATDHANQMNQSDFGRRFDWLDNPGRAWVAVPVGQRGRLRENGRA
jgi:hypothetical protein